VSHARTAGSEVQPLTFTFAISIAHNHACTLFNNRLAGFARLKYSKHHQSNLLYGTSNTLLFSKTLQETLFFSITKRERQCLSGNRLSIRSLTPRRPRFDRPVEVPTMHDLRRQALESGKTVSKKAQSRQSSRASSRANSAPNSRVTSRNASRHGSDEEEGGNLSDGTAWRYSSPLSGACRHLYARDHCLPWRLRKDRGHSPSAAC
jgi:hypothetical protein